jgi:hypothetical protein
MRPGSANLFRSSVGYSIEAGAQAKRKAAVTDSGPARVAIRDGFQNQSSPRATTIQAQNY